MVKRQLPNPSEIFELLHFKTPELNPRRRRLDAALTTWDLRKIAKRRTPAAPSTTPTAPPRARSPCAAPARPSATSSSTPTSCARPSTSTPPARSWADARPCPSASHPPASPASCRPRARSPGRGRRRRRDPLHPVHAGHHLHRGRQGRQPPRAQLVPALRHAPAARSPTGLVERAAAAGFDTPHVHRGHPRGRGPPARQAQRLLHPAPDHGRHRPQRDPPPVVVVRLS